MRLTILRYAQMLILGTLIAIVAFANSSAASELGLSHSKVRSTCEDNCYQAYRKCGERCEGASGIVCVEFPQPIGEQCWQIWKICFQGCEAGLSACLASCNTESTQLAVDNNANLPPPPSVCFTAPQSYACVIAWSGDHYSLICSQSNYQEWQCAEELPSTPLGDF